MTNDITFTRQEVSRVIPDWQKVDDVIAGERTIKEGKEAYLPKPNKSDQSDENKDRYDQ